MLASVIGDLDALVRGERWVGSDEGDSGSACGIRMGPVVAGRDRSKTALLSHSVLSRGRRETLKVARVAIRVATQRNPSGKARWDPCIVGIINLVVTAPAQLLSHPDDDECR